MRWERWGVQGACGGCRGMWGARWMGGGTVAGDPFRCMRSWRSRTCCRCGCCRCECCRLCFSSVRAASPHLSVPHPPTTSPAPQPALPPHGVAAGWRWYVNFWRLVLFATLLLPGFLQMVAFYFFSPRLLRSVPYGDKVLVCAVREGLGGCMRSVPYGEKVCCALCAL